MKFAIKLSVTFVVTTEKCILSNDVMDYHIVSQGKTTIPNVNDGEELELTDVRAPRKKKFLNPLLEIFHPSNLTNYQELFPMVVCSAIYNFIFWFEHLLLLFEIIPT